MRITFRSWFIVGTLGVLLAAVSLLSKPVLADPDAVFEAAPETEEAPAAESEFQAEGPLTEESLGTLLESMGLELTKEEKRYDFTFTETFNGEEWQLSMSAVLSQDGETVWVMAWLDELPKSAADVPRSSLLRLLGENDKLGGGKFFAFIPGNRRFVLERVIANNNLSGEKFRAVLNDLGQSAAVTYPLWYVANWNAPTPAAEANSAEATPNAASEGAPKSPRRLPSAVNDSKFQELRRN